MKATEKNSDTDKQQTKIRKDLLKQEHRKGGGTMTLGGGVYSLEKKQII